MSGTTTTMTRTTSTMTATTAILDAAATGVAAIIPGGGVEVEATVMPVAEAGLLVEVDALAMGASHLRAAVLRLTVGVVQAEAELRRLG